MPSTAVEILPCSNFEAANQGLVSAVDTASVLFLEDIDYLIGDELVAIELTPIDFYCVHQPT